MFWAAVSSLTRDTRAVFQCKQSGLTPPLFCLVLSEYAQPMFTLPRPFYLNSTSVISLIICDGIPGKVEWESLKPSFHGLVKRVTYMYIVYYALYYALFKGWEINNLYYIWPFINIMMIINLSDFESILTVVVCCAFFISPYVFSLSTEVVCMVLQMHIWIQIAQLVDHQIQEQ